MTAKQRRETWIDYVISMFVERMIQFGIVDKAQANGYKVMDDLLAPSELDKAELLPARHCEQVILLMLVSLRC